MKENEERLSAAQQKARIRDRYRGIDADELDVIPALPPETLDGTPQHEKRVAVYARVSTDDPRQTSSYELQKNHYTDTVSRHEGWRLVDIYADEGISGTSLLHRDSFIRMINDCKAGKIDLILTKSVSRFARNVLDCIGYVRELAAMQPPIGVLFETENIYTLNSNSEMSLSFISTLAQEESHTKSEIMNSSIEMRFKRGIFLTPELFGYSVNDDGDLVINEEEAPYVRLMFFMYLYGYTCQEIADSLTRLGVLTKRGHSVWSAGTVTEILKNERHCGDVLARKTWTPSYLNHKAKKNKQDRNQYRKRDHHEAIVSRDDYIAVQRLLSNAKYGNKGFLPELQVVTQGILKGYVSINPRWAGFTSEDYYEASESVSSEPDSTASEVGEQMALRAGDFDFRGFEVARSQFFDNNAKIILTFSTDGIKFSTGAVRKFTLSKVELLLHPIEKFFAVRPAAPTCRNAVAWAHSEEGVILPKYIPGTAYLKTVYDMMGWDLSCKYRVFGTYQERCGEPVLIFDMKDTVIFIPNKISTVDNDTGETVEAAPVGEGITPLMETSKAVLAYPASWADTFGPEYCCQAGKRTTRSLRDSEEWNAHSAGMPYKEPDLHITDEAELQIYITSRLSSAVSQGGEDQP